MTDTLVCFSLSTQHELVANQYILLPYMMQATNLKLVAVTHRVGRVGAFRVQRSDTRNRCSHIYNITTCRKGSWRDHVKVIESLKVRYRELVHACLQLAFNGVMSRSCEIRVPISTIKNQSGEGHMKVIPESSVLNNIRFSGWINLLL